MKERQFRLSALAHVYVRRGGRWRYARTYRVGAAAAALQTDDPAGLRPFAPVRAIGTPKGFASVSLKGIRP